MIFETVKQNENLHSKIKKFVAENSNFKFETNNEKFYMFNTTDRNAVLDIMNRFKLAGYRTTNVHNHYYNLKRVSLSHSKKKVYRSEISITKCSRGIYTIVVRNKSFYKKFGAKFEIISDTQVV